MKHKIFSILVFSTVCSYGQLKPAKIFSDNMVLQREVPIPLWGTANPGERVVVSLESSSVVATTDSDGNWKVNLPQFRAGGPYKLTVEGSTDKIEFKNVLIGDVWFASGQSNMEHPMNGWEWIPHSNIHHSEEEIEDSDYPEIRLFLVPRFPSPVEQKDLSSGKWEIAGPNSVAGFSATAWFFSKELYHNLKIPIGIISSSWGGTPIQTWMSRESLESFKDSVDLPAVPSTFEQTIWSAKAEESIEKSRLRRNQISYPKEGLPEKINSLEMDDSSWKQVGFINQNSGFGNIVWLRKKISVPEKVVRQQLELSLGFLNRQSQVFLNGTELGYFQYPQPARIVIPQKLVNPGENILTIRIAQPWLKTQAIGENKQFYISNSDRTYLLNIAENWKANDQLESAIPSGESYQGNPAFLFNGMVAPVIPYGIKGFIWNQGENNAGQPYLYEKLFRQLIIDWRKLWKQEDLPFLFVQSSNIDQSHEYGKKTYSSCLLREAQQKALSLPQTGMVVSIDIGDSLDVHPKNKQDFGHRLALQALKIAYHQDIIADGPVYESFKIKGDTVVVQLNDGNSPIKKNMEQTLCSFEIAASDGVFREAKACLRNNHIYVFSEGVKNPVTLRYAWSDNPRCCLYNEAGLPAAPFRTNQLIK